MSARRFCALSCSCECRHNHFSADKSFPAVEVIGWWQLLSGVWGMVQMVHDWCLVRCLAH